jgi:hypothetical protein
MRGKCKYFCHHMGHCALHISCLITSLCHCSTWIWILKGGSLCKDYSCHLLFLSCESMQSSSSWLSSSNRASSHRVTMFHSCWVLLTRLSSYRVMVIFLTGSSSYRVVFQQGHLLTGGTRRSSSYRVIFLQGHLLTGSSSSSLTPNLPLNGNTITPWPCRVLLTGSSSYRVIFQHHFLTLSLVVIIQGSMKIKNSPPPPPSLLIIIPRNKWVWV